MGRPQNPKLQVVQLLMHYGALRAGVVDMIDVEGNSALGICLGRGDLDVSKMLVEHGADVNETAAVASTLRPLSVACDCCDVEVARILLGAGAKIVIADLSGDAAAALADELGPSAASAAADCTSEADVLAALDLAEKSFGAPVSAAVSTAGTLHAAKAVSRKGAPHPLEPFERVLRVNVLGSFNVARLAAARMAARAPDAETGERGVLVPTASIAAFDGQVGQVAYAASKAAVAGMTLPLARDLSPHHIRCVTIAPGLFNTPMMEGLPDHIKDELANAVPCPRRLGDPSEYAKLVESIIENPMLNGETIRLDGAYRMPP